MNLKNNASLLQRLLAKTKIALMIVFMFKGLYTNTTLPYAHFATSSLIGADMFPLLWKAIERLTQTGCCVLGVTGDGGIPNRTLFQLHQLPEDPKKIIYKALNVFTDEANDIFYRPVSSA